MGAGQKRPGTWTAAIGEYVVAMKTARRARGTINLHRSYLRGLSSHVRGGPWSVATSDLERWLARDGWSQDARKSARSVACSFYRWAHGKGYITDDPAYGLASIRVPRTRRRYPAPELVVSQLVDDPRQPDRLVFMGELAAFNGLRAGEIAAVHGRDLDEGNGLTVHGKGGKARRVIITDEKLLWRLRKLGTAPDAWAFPNGRGSHLSPGHVTRLMSEALPGKWTAHTFRHRFATTANDNGVDLIALSEALGHASVATTQIYVLSSERQLRAVSLAGGRRPAAMRAV